MKTQSTQNKDRLAGIVPSHQKGLSSSRSVDAPVGTFRPIDWSAQCRGQKRSFNHPCNYGVSFREMHASGDAAACGSRQWGRNTQARDAVKLKTKPANDPAATARTGSREKSAMLKTNSTYTPLLTAAPMEFAAT